MFHAFTFILSNRVQSSTITLIKEHGGRVRSSVQTAIAREAEEDAPITTIGVQADAAAHGNLDGLADADALRALRLPVVHERWVRACALAGEVLPVDGTAFVVYDPFSFDGIHFTTTQLPQWIKANVVAALQFHGALYSPHLTTTTHFVVHNELHHVVREGSSDSTVSSEGAAAPPRQVRASDKLQAAKAHGVPLVTLGWILRRLAEGRRVLPALADLLAAPKSVRSSPGLSQLPPSPLPCTPPVPLAGRAPLRPRAAVCAMVQHFAVEDRTPTAERGRGRPRNVESDAGQWRRLDVEDEGNKENVDPAARYPKKAKVVKL